MTINTSSNDRTAIATAGLAPRYRAAAMAVVATFPVPQRIHPYARMA